MQNLNPDPAMDTPLQKFYRHEKSLIQEFIDHNCDPDEEGEPDPESIANSYLAIYHQNHDDLADMISHIKILNNLSSTIAAITQHWMDYLNTLPNNLKPEKQ